MTQLKRAIAPILLLAIAWVSPLWSGETGKIAGTITDKATGEPLPGANIVVVGTTMGAATDAEGRYTILKVPPGTYSVRVSFIGYSTVTINDVRVHIDQTTPLDVALLPTTIEGTEVVIIAERPAIKRDVATSVVAVSETEMATLPITSVVSAIGLQAGIRGGWGGPLGGAALYVPFRCFFRPPVRS